MNVTAPLIVLGVIKIHKFKSIKICTYVLHILQKWVKSTTYTIMASNHSALTIPKYIIAYRSLYNALMLCYNGLQRF